MPLILILLIIVTNFTLIGSEYTLLSCHDEPYSHIAFINDNHGNRFVIKQVTQETLKEQFLLVMDCLAAHMADALDIPCNKVTIIPAHIEHCGKKWVHLPATMHTFAPGTMLSVADCPYAHLDIQQRHRVIGSWVWQKHGMLKPTWRGLTRLAIQHMALHPQLPGLVAFDTFIGNNDRGTPNLFYDSTTDSFCGIDMGNAYGQNLCKEAVCSLLSMYHDAYQFSAEELSALKVYKQTLDQLITLYTPKKIHALLDEFGDRAKLSEATYDQLNYDQRLQWYKDMISESYHDAMALSTLLEMLLSTIDSDLTLS